MTNNGADNPSIITKKRKIRNNDRWLNNANARELEKKTS